MFISYRLGIFFLGFTFFSFSLIYSQDQKLADSLIKLYESGKYDGDKLLLLEQISAEETNPDVVIAYANELITLAEKDGRFDLLSSGFLQRGNGQWKSGEFDLALESFFESLRFAKQINMKREEGLATIAIASLYSEIGNSANAKVYYENGKIQKSTTTAFVSDIYDRWRTRN
jgi:tetratricopeptide (TPR) repeat protein